VPGYPGGTRRNGHPTSFVKVAKKIVDASQLVNILWAMAKGEPEVRYRDSTGKPVADPAKHKGDQPLQIEVVYPTIAERQAAARWLWDRVEPKETKIKLELETARPAIKPTGAALDAYIEAREKMKLLESGDAVPSADGEDAVKEEP
jgi:hypothetical protein